MNISVQLKLRASRWIDEGGAIVQIGDVLFDQNNAPVRCGFEPPGIFPVRAASQRQLCARNARANLPEKTGVPRTTAVNRARPGTAGGFSSGLVAKLSRTFIPFCLEETILARCSIHRSNLQVRRSPVDGILFDASIRLCEFNQRAHVAMEFFLERPDKTQRGACPPRNADGLKRLSCQVILIIRPPPEKSLREAFAA